MRPAARLLDLCTCIYGCSAGFIFVTRNISTFINMLPSAGLFDLTTNCAVGIGCWLPNEIITGSFNTFINGRPAARLGDLDTGGLIASGSFNTFIG